LRRFTHVQNSISSLGKCATILTLGLLTAVPTAAKAGEFIQADKLYKLTLQDYWETTLPPPVADIVFVCSEKVCGKGVCEGDQCSRLVQFMIISFKPIDVRGNSQSEFFRDFPMSEVQGLVQDILAAGTKSYHELSALKRQHFGQNDFYVTDYAFAYKTGLAGNMMYAATFDHGFFYQFQFLAPEGTLNDHKARFEQVLTSLEFLEVIP
jgi:hypothetical protein